MWTLALEYHEDRMTTHGYAPTREAAMALACTHNVHPSAHPDLTLLPPGSAT